MPVDYYTGKGLEELEKLLKTVQDRQAKGGLRDVTIAGVRTRREFDHEQNSLQEIERIRYSLFLRAQADTTENRAELLLKWPNPFLEKVRTTRARYTFS